MILWLGYGSLDRIYRHPGRATKEILSELEHERVLFVGGVVVNLYRTWLKNGNNIINGYCYWDNGISLFFKIFLRFYRMVIFLPFLLFLSVKSKPEVVIVDHVCNLWFGRIICRITKCKLLYRNYGVWDSFDKVSKPVDLARSHLRNIDSLLVTQDGTNYTPYQKAAQELGVPFYLLKNASTIDYEYSIDKRLSYQNELIRVCFLTTFSKGKGIEVIYEILRILSSHTNMLGVEFIFIGDGEALEDLKQCVLKLELSVSTVFTGRIAPNTVKKHLETSNVLICINSNNPVLEGISTGNIVIVNEFGCVQELYGDCPSVHIVAPIQNTISDYYDIKNVNKIALAFVNELESIFHCREGIKNDILDSTSWIRRSFPPLKKRVFKEVSWIENYLGKK